VSAYRVWEPLHGDEAGASEAHGVDIYEAAENFCDQMDNDGSEMELRIHVRDEAGVLHKLDVMREYKCEHNAWDAKEDEATP
jgi:hypothetical protein